MDTKVHHIRRMCRGHRQHRRRHKCHRRLRSHLLNNPVDLERTRQVYLLHEVHLHSNHRHRMPEQVQHRHITHRLVDMEKALETHGLINMGIHGGVQEDPWEKVNLIMVCR